MHFIHTLILLTNLEKDSIILDKSKMEGIEYTSTPVDAKKGFKVVVSTNQLESLECLSNLLPQEHHMLFKKKYEKIRDLLPI